MPAQFRIECKEIFEYFFEIGGVPGKFKTCRDPYKDLDLYIHRQKSYLPSDALPLYVVS
jgi:hypothetical protein